VAEARQAMVALNEKNGETGRAPLNYGIGVHVGDVMYGNIGSRTRLDFTVIGPAVNMASRLETLTKQLGRTVLLSRAFADFVESDFDLETRRRISGARLQRPNRAVCVSRLNPDLSLGAEPPPRGANSSNGHYERMSVSMVASPRNKAQTLKDG
jgi:class 3 adenylate cyclase